MKHKPLTKEQWRIVALYGARQSPNDLGGLKAFLPKPDKAA